MIRDARAEDAQGLWELGRALLTDGRGTVQSLDDLRTIEALRERSYAVDLVADDEGAIVGHAAISKMGRAAYLAHVGVLAMGVHPEHQRKGWGRKLLRALVERAPREGIIRLELYCRADNDRALALYRSEGFVHEGTRAKLVRLPDGTFVDDHVMVRFFPHQPTSD